MNVHPAFRIPIIVAIKLLSLGSIAKTLLFDLTPFLISALAIRFALMLSSLLVNVASVATSAMFSGLSSTCFSKRLWMNGVSTGLKVGISFVVSSSTSQIIISLTSLSMN